MPRELLSEFQEHGERGSDAPPAPVQFAKYAESTISRPQPGLVTLNAARESAFTGEITFMTSPVVNVYVDGGRPYYAERADRPSIGRQLLATGVVDTAQLERGTVRVGDVEHLGRLFDREPSVDRDAVMVIVEESTAEIVNEVATAVTASVVANPYRHHQSGIHRWFVAPGDPTLARPVSRVAQVDRSVVEELPDISRPIPRIEWDQPTIPPVDRLEADDVEADPAAVGASVLSDVEIQAELDRFDADRADWSGALARPLVPTSDDDADGDRDRNVRPSSAATDTTPDWLSEFKIVWPDGTEERAIDRLDGSYPRVQPSTAISPDGDPFDPPTAPLAAPTGELLVDAPQPSSPHTAPPVPDDSSTVPETPDPGTSPFLPPAGAAFAPPTAAATSGLEPMRLQIPTVKIDSVPAPDAAVPAVPADVVDAVRRALLAIEGATSGPATLPQMDIAPITLPELTTPGADVEPQPPVPVAADPAPVGPANVFAPPTLDTSAEVLYAEETARATEQHHEPTFYDQAADDPAVDDLEPRRASVVFVDDDPEVDDDGGDDDRSGALRRLIGSLRRKV